VGFELREVTIVTALRFGQTRVRFQAGAEGLPIVQNSQSRSGVHEAPPIECELGSFPGGKAAEA